MDTWNRDMAAAPRDGTIVWVADPDCGAFIMRWNREGYNDTFAPYDIGIWEALDKSFTWSESRGMGPTKWKSADCPNGSVGWDSL